MTDAMDRAIVHARRWLSTLDAQPVEARADLQELRRRFEAPLPEVGADPIEIIDDLAARAEDGLLGVAGGRFFAWVKGSSVEASLAADWLAIAWDQNPALYACAPSISVIEEWRVNG